MVAYKSGGVNPPIKETIYKDLGLSFTPNPITGKVSVLENENAIIRALKNLIFTNKGEKLFRPLYGGNITALLFENRDKFTEQSIKSRITKAIGTYEKRVSLLDVFVDSDPDDNDLNVTIVFSILSSNKIVETTFQVERIR